MKKQKYREAVQAEMISILKAERLARALSMNRVAELAGLSQQTISYIERGMKKPTLDSIHRIADALELDLGNLVHRAQDSIPGPKKS